MKFKKVAALLLAGVMCAATVVGCGKSDDGKADSTTTPKADESKVSDAETTTAEDEKLTATITVWSPAEDQDEKNGNWLKTRCDAFNAAHPNWDLTFQYNVCGEDKAAENVTKDPSAAADVYMFANDQVQKLLDAGAISRLGGDTEAYIKDTNAESMVKTVTVGDAVYGVPYTANTWFMYYDKSVFSEDDIKNLDTMLEKGVVSFPLTNSWYLASFYAGNGCTFFGDGYDASKGIDFSGQKASDVTEYLIDLKDNKNFKIDVDGSGIAGIRDGSIKAMFSGSWDYAEVKKALGDNMGVAQLPKYTLNGEEKQMYSFAGSKAMAVSSKTEYPQVAVALARYLASESAQKSHYDIRNIIPCNTKLLENEVFQSDELVQAQNNTVANTSIIQPFITEMGNYWTPTDNFGKSLRNNEITHDNAADMTEKWNKDMNTSAVN